MYVIEFHAPDFLELFLDPPAIFKGINEATFNGFLVKLSMRIKELEHTGDCLTYSDHIPLVKIIAKLEILVDGIRIIPFTHLSEVFRKIVHNQTILVGKVLRPHLGNFPAGQVRMHSVKKGSVNHILWERSKKVSGLYKGIHALVDITNKDHGCIGIDDIPAP